MAQLVSEKDSGLRQAMRTMGLMESSYWGSWVVFDLAFGVLLALVIVFSGDRGEGVGGGEKGVTGPGEGPAQEADIWLCRRFPAVVSAASNCWL
jgi:hypothetical protein